VFFEYTETWVQKCSKRGKTTRKSAKQR